MYFHEANIIIYVSLCGIMIHNASLLFYFCTHGMGTRARAHAHTHTFTHTRYRKDMISINIYIWLNYKFSAWYNFRKCRKWIIKKSELNQIILERRNQCFVREQYLIVPSVYVHWCFVFICLDETLKWAENVGNVDWPLLLR